MLFWVLIMAHVLGMFASSAAFVGEWRYRWQRVQVDDALLITVMSIVWEATLVLLAWRWLVMRYLEDRRRRAKPAPLTDGSSADVH